MAALLLEAGVLLAVIAVGGAVAARVGQSVIPAYILVGVLVGPHSPVAAARIVESQPFVDLLAELGIVLLLFFVGLEFDLGRLAANRDRMLRAGGLDAAVNGGAGLLVAFALGFGALEAVLLAGVVYISSSAVITKSLVDLGWVADPESEAVIGVLVFEDLVIAVYLAVVAAVLAGGGSPAAVARPLAVAVGFVLVLVALAAYGTPLVERALDTPSDELFLVRVVAAAALVGGVALALGVSEAVAAFFLGTAVGATDHVERIERTVVSERDLYAAVFFFAIGLETDPATVLPVLGPLAVLVVVTTATKLASGYLGGRAYGLNERRSTRVALALVARGEFSLVIAAIALGAGFDTVAALAVGYVLAMSVLGTVLMRYSAPVERFVTRRAGA